MPHLAFVTNLFSGPDLIIVLVIVLIIFGPKKLPELAKGMGQAIKEFNKAKDEIHRELVKPADVTVQPAPGQQPRQPAEMPTVPPAPLPMAQAAPPPAPAADFSTGTAFAPQPGTAPQPQPPQEVHPAGQA